MKEKVRATPIVNSSVPVVVSAVCFMPTGGGDSEATFIDKRFLRTTTLLDVKKALLARYGVTMEAAQLFDVMVAGDCDVDQLTQLGMLDSDMVNVIIAIDGGEDVEPCEPN